jgi:hypothetical protein
MEIPASRELQSLPATGRLNDLIPGLFQPGHSHIPDKRIVFYDQKRSSGPHLPGFLHCGG